MSKYAIIKIGTFQYTVDEGKEYTVPNFEAEVGNFKVTDVLAIGEDNKLVVGTPNVDKGIVELEILNQGKGEKVTSRIYKAKSRYRRARGYRKSVTTFKVVSIKY